ncbi:hypothetical protein ACFQU7_00695 [Pseudoroseomonas wenyumeiae]
MLAALPSCAQPVAAPRAATAATPALEIGPDGLNQGGLALGRVAPGSRVTLDGKPVQVAPDGRFAIGFGRDAGPQARLAATAPGGATETRELAIAKRDWDVQRLTGLPQAMVSPMRSSSSASMPSASGWRPCGR